MANNKNGLHKLIINNEIPVLKQSLQKSVATNSKKADEKIINDFESMPDYNPIQAVSDFIVNAVNPYNDAPDRRKAAYDKRQSMVDEYNAAKERQITAALNAYKPQSDNTIPMLAGSKANELLHPFQYSAAEKEIEPYLKENGITLDQLKQYYMTQALQEQNKQMAQNASDHSVGNTLKSIVANQIGALNTGADTIASVLQGKPIGTNTAVNTYADLAPTIRGNIRENIQQNAKTDLGGKAGALAYDVGTSLGDMGLSLALGGGNQAASLGLMAYNAGANTLDEQKDKNTTVGQKLATAITSGAIEALTEKLPLDNLFRLANNPAGKQTAKQIFRNIVGQMASEGSEELVSDLANAITDNFFNQSQSDYQQSMAAYMAQGMTRDQAQTQAMKDIVNNAMYSGLAGALSGGVMAGGASAINNSANNNVKNDIPKVESKVEQTQNTTIPKLLSMATNDNYSLAQNGEVNPWAMQEQGETIADRIRSMRGFEHTDFDGRMVDEPIPTANQKTETKTLKPLESYDAKSIKGFPDITKQISRNVLWYGKDNEVVAQKYAEAIQNINRYLETYDQKSINDAVNALTEIDKQLQGKTNTYNGKTYTYPSGSIVEQFIDDSKPLYDMDRHNAIGTEIPQIKAENKTTDYSKLDKAVGMYANAEGKKTYGQIKQYIDRYSQTGDENFLNLAKNMIPIVEQSMKGKSYKAKDKTVYNYKDGRFTKDINKVIPQIGEKPKSKRSQVMAEDIGLNPKSNEDAEIPKVTERGDELVAEITNLNTSTRFATNSMLNNMPSLQNEEGQSFVWQGIQNGDYNKETNATNKVNVLHNEDAEKQARDMISKHRDILDKRIESGDVSDPIVFEAILQLQEQAQESKDWAKARYYSMKAAGKSTDIGRMMQLLAKRSKRDAASAIQKADVLIGQLTKSKLNGKTKDSCGKLATALKNIGNDHTNDTIRQPKTYQQIRNGVVNELSKKSSSVFDNFTDKDIDYMARMVEKGYTSQDIQYRLEERLATGSWEISDADLEQVTKLFDEADKYGEDSKQRMELEDKAYSILAKYLPDTTFMDKWNAWRYLSMLGNPRTHIRNIIGNKMFGALTNVKDSLAGLIESAVVKDPSLRTKSAFVDGNFRKEAEADGQNVWRKLTEGGHKYDMKKEIDSNRRIFKNEWLEKIQKLNSNLLEKEDNSALVKKYGRALAGYLQAQGKDASIFQSQNPADVELLDQAREYAIEQAKIATFHEDSDIANWLTQAAKNAASPDASKAKRIAGFLLESVLPFKKTPINILKQGAVEYNPLQLVHGVYDAIVNGDNPSKAIDELARGTSGSLVMLLGYMLARSGALRPSYDEDDKNLDKLTGEQQYAINIPGTNKSYTLDWAAPAALPLFVGAELYKWGEEGDLDVISALSSVSDPIVEMSMLQGLKNTLESTASFVKGKNTMGDTVTNMAFGYAGQGIPTVGGQVARSIDDTRRSTYTGEQGTMDTIMRNVKKIENKIPVLSSLNEPYVDAWGDTQENGNIPFLGNKFLSRLAYNMVSPGYISDTSKTDTENELYRLQNEMKQGNIEQTNIVPSVAGKTHSGERINPKDYTQVSITQGKNAERIMSETISNPIYAGLDDQEKSEVLHDVLLFSNALSQSESFDDKDIATNKTYKKKYEAYERGGVDGLLQFMQISKNVSNGLKADGKTSANNADNFKAVDALDIPKSDKAYYLKQRIDYSEKAKFIDAINPEYAYDWYAITSKYGTKKADIELGISLSDLSLEEKQTLLYVNEMKDADAKLNNVMNGITE